MAEDRWYRIAIPILEYVANNGGPFVLLSMGDIADALHLDPMEVATELDELCAAGYVAGDVRKMLTGGDARPWYLEKSLLAK